MLIFLLMIAVGNLSWVSSYEPYPIILIVLGIYSYVFISIINWEKDSMYKRRPLIVSVMIIFVFLLVCIMFKASKVLIVVARDSDFFKKNFFIEENIYLSLAFLLLFIVSVVNHIFTLKKIKSNKFKPNELALYHCFYLPGLYIEADNTYEKHLLTLKKIIKVFKFVMYSSYFFMVASCMIIFYLTNKTFTARHILQMTFMFSLHGSIFLLFYTYLYRVLHQELIFPGLIKDLEV